MIAQKCIIVLSKSWSPIKFFMSKYTVIMLQKKEYNKYYTVLMCI